MLSVYKLMMPMYKENLHFITNDKINENQTPISQTYIPILFYKHTIIKEVKIWQAILSGGIHGNI